MGYIFEPHGKCSKAWWLQLVEWFGENSAKGISNKGQVPAHQVRKVLCELMIHGLIDATGPVGRGHSPKYVLTKMGEKYLSDHSNEIGEDVLIKPTFSWKRIMGGQIRYFIDSQVIAPSLVPEEQMERMLIEQKHAPSPALKHLTAMPGLGRTHKVPDMDWSKKSPRLSKKAAAVSAKAGMISKTKRNTRRGA